MTAKSQKTAGSPASGGKPEATAGATPHAQGSSVVNVVSIAVSPRDGTIADVQSLAPAFQAGFRRCYDKGLQEDPGMKGSFRLTVRVGPNGGVLSVSSENAKLSATVVLCAAARVSATHFPPPVGGSATVVIAVDLAPY